MTQFRPQKGEHVRKLTAPIDYSDKLASIKLDGIRSVTVDGSSLTYSLKPVPNNHIRTLLAPYQHLDGEVIVGPPNLASTFNTTTSAMRRVEGAPDFTFYVFDEISPESLLLPFEDRLQRLHERRAQLPSFVEILEQQPVRSQDDCDAYYEQILAMGYEGLMLRNAKSMYKFGRCTATSQDNLKLKPEEDDEAIVLSVIEGTANTNEAFTNEHGRTARSSHQDGKIPNGMCGGLLARDLKTGLEFVVAPGKMSHSLRVWVWQNRDKVVGRICKYRHSPIGVLAGGLPRFPRWVGWREAFDM